MMKEKNILDIDMVLDYTLEGMDTSITKIYTIEIDKLLDEEILIVR